MTFSSAEYRGARKRVLAAAKAEPMVYKPDNYAYIKVLLGISTAQSSPPSLQFI